MFNNTIIVIIIIIHNDRNGSLECKKTTSIKKTKHLQNKISKKWHKVTEKREEDKRKIEVRAHFMCGKRRDNEEMI